MGADVVAHVMVSSSRNDWWSVVLYCVFSVQPFSDGDVILRVHDVPPNKWRHLAIEKTKNSNTAMPPPSPHPPPPPLLPLLLLGGGEVSVDEIVNVSVAVPVPPVLIADTVTTLIAAAVGVPVIIPVDVANTRPAGRPVAAKLVGLLVAVMV